MGVFPPRLNMIRFVFSLPHARGGVSKICMVIVVSIASSPRPWGCFWSLSGSGGLLAVFPTPVGVFLEGTLPESEDPGLPHARGGVSKAVGVLRDSGWSSPRPWGCFQYECIHKVWRRVFPTPVGVFPVTV